MWCMLEVEFGRVVRVTKTRPTVDGRKDFLEYNIFMWIRRRPAPSY